MKCVLNTIQDPTSNANGNNMHYMAIICEKDLEGHGFQQTCTRLSSGDYILYIERFNFIKMH
jgi:hypothetical protein